MPSNETDCLNCGNVITTKHPLLPGERVVCEECCGEKPLCDICKQPVGGWNPFQSRWFDYCEEHMDSRLYGG